VTFAPDYASARERFRAAAHARGWACQAYPVAGAGPNGESLTVDVAISPSSHQPTGDAVVVSSGLHGVEGYFGSAVQIAALESGDEWLAGARGVFVHALNPYGFAWSRRCDADNVDLNRAFRWPDMPAADRDDDYARLDSLLNPPRPPSFDLFPLRIRLAALMHGRAALSRTIASGQRSFPKGLFYASKTTTATQQLLDAHLRQWVGGATTVVHLDLHTGLGRTGEHVLIVDYALAEPARVWLARTFGVDVIRESTRDPRAYTAVGSFGQWCVASQVAPDYRFAFAELGTYDNVSVLAGLRAENQAAHWAAPDDPRATRARARLRELFCPASPQWRDAAVASGVALVARAAAGLAADRAGRPTMPHGAGLGEQGR
jgi:predicted deacylase